MSLGGWLLLIVVAFLLFIIIQFAQAISESNEREKINDKKKEEVGDASQERYKLIQDNGFTITKKFESRFANRLSTVIIDDEKKFVIFDLKPVPYENIINAELLSREYQTNTTTTDKSNGIGRAVAGGIIAGGAGAIVGAATTKGTATTNTSTNLTYTGIRVFLSDVECPLLEISYNNKQFLLDVYSTLLAIIAQNQKGTAK